jgi:hypothetical protein
VACLGGAHGLLLPAPDDRPEARDGPGRMATRGSHRMGLNMFFPDGRDVLLSSLAANLVPGDTNAIVDVFVKALPGRSSSRPWTTSRRIGPTSRRPAFRPASPSRLWRFGETRGSPPAALRRETERHRESSAGEAVLCVDVLPSQTLRMGAAQYVAGMGIPRALGSQLRGRRESRANRDERGRPAGLARVPALCGVGRG